MKTVSLLRKLSPITLLRYWVLSTQKRILTSIEYSPKSIKIGGEALKSQLTTLFHQPIKRSIFTDNLKTSFIYPIHKGDSDSACSNYRPISIPHLFSKKFKKLMSSRLLGFIETNDPLYKNQFNFQRGKSTEHTILITCETCIQKTAKNYKKKEKNSRTFLDLAKAFDTDNHEIFLNWSTTI